MNTTALMVAAVDLFLAVIALGWAVTDTLEERARERRIRRGSR